MSKTCKCGEGYASELDGVCKFCRERMFSRAEAKQAGVRYRGHGMTLDQRESIHRRKWWPWPPSR